MASGDLPGTRGRVAGRGAPGRRKRKAQARAAAIAARKSCYEMPLPPPFLPAAPCLPGMLPQPLRYLVRFSAHKLCRREPVKQRIPPKLSVHCPVEVKQSVSTDAGIGCDEMQRGELTFGFPGSISGAHLPPLCARGRSCSSMAWRGAIARLMDALTPTAGGRGRSSRTPEGTQEVG